MPFVIGLTGGVASGKSTVSKLFADAGIPVIDADIISHQLCEPGQSGYDAIVTAFGSEVVDAQGRLDRSALRQRIFSDADARRTLENILHPLIRQRIIKAIEASTSDLIILAVPLLIEANMQSLADRILVVDCDPAQQLKRLCERDNIDAQLAKAMLSAQTDPELRLQSADDIIDNNNDYDALQTQVKHLLSFYQSLALQRKTPSDD